MRFAVHGLQRSVQTGFHPHLDQLINVMDQLLALLGRASSPAPEVSAQGKAVRTGPRDPKTAPAQKEASRTLHSQSFQSADAKLLDVPSESPARATTSRTGNPLWLGLRALVTPPTGRISRKVFWIAIVESVLCIAVALCAGPFLDLWPHAKCGAADLQSSC